MAETEQRLEREAAEEDVALARLFADDDSFSA